MVDHRTIAVDRVVFAIRRCEGIQAVPYSPDDRQWIVGVYDRPVHEGPPSIAVAHIEFNKGAAQVTLITVSSGRPLLSEPIPVEKFTSTDFVSFLSRLERP